MSAMHQVKKFAITLSAQLFSSHAKNNNNAPLQVPDNNKAGGEGCVRLMKKTVKQTHKQTLSDYTIF